MTTTTYNIDERGETFHFRQNGRLGRPYPIVATSRASLAVFLRRAVLEHAIAALEQSVIRGLPDRDSLADPAVANALRRLATMIDIRWADMPAVETLAAWDAGDCYDGSGASARADYVLRELAQDNIASAAMYAKRI